MARRHMATAIAVACATAVALGWNVAAPARQAEAKAVKAPAKVKVKSAKRAGNVITVKVGKAKGAKGYQYKVTIGKRSWTKMAGKTSAKVRVTSDGTGKVKVRAWAKKGKKKVWGKWSKAVKFGARGSSDGNAGSPATSGGTSASGKEQAAAKLPEPRYSYRVRFLRQPVAANSTGYSVSPQGVVYVETDNPDPMFVIRVAGAASSGGDIVVPTSGEKFGDGYVAELGRFTRPGRYGVTVSEISQEGYDRAAKRYGTLAKSTGYDSVGQFLGRNPGLLSEYASTSAKSLGTVDVLDWDEQMDAWMDSVIAEAVTDRSAPKADQMRQICNWLMHHHVYFEASGLTAAQEVVLDADHSRFWDEVSDMGAMRYDSAFSGAMAKAFGERIGYPLVNMWELCEFDGGKRKLRESATEAYPGLAKYSGQDLHAGAWSPDDDQFFSPLTAFGRSKSSVPSFDPTTWEFYNLR